MVSSGRFQIRDITAAGANGTVCIAIDRAHERDVALKVLKSHVLDSPDLARRHRDEARMLSRLDHPDIVRVFEMFEIEDHLVVVMEALSGLPLDQLVRRLGRGLPPPIALEVARLVAAALDAAYHAPTGPEQAPMRVIHRDIKPSNVFFTAAGEVKVVDFGLAKGEFDDRETVTAARVIGSRGYLAPERLDGQPDSPKGDVYALGLTLFEVLTGKPLVLSLHPDKQAAALERNLQYLAREMSSEELAAGAQELLRDMCAYRSADRPDTGEVAERLGGLLERAGERPDLIDFAATHVAPGAHGVHSPRDHPKWGSVAFLESVPMPSSSGLDDPAPPPRSRAPGVHLRHFLRQAGWERRVADLRLVVANTQAGGLQPLFDVLDRAAVPWWRFWVSPATPTQVAAALEAIGTLDGHGKPLRARVRLLADHPEPTISAAARSLLDAR